MESVSPAAGYNINRSAPLVSVVLFCRNGGEYLRRSVESVLHQTYPHIQYVVQDGASNDGTTDYLASLGNKIELVSVPDKGTNDGFGRALERCRGDIIVACLADEALMPHAAERAVEEFVADPSLGAVTGDAYLWNDSGTTFGVHRGQDFDFLGYLIGDYCPNFSASFFRRSALSRLGFFADRWKQDSVESIEFELWCRLGTDHRVKYVPYIFSKYGINDRQMGQNLRRILGELSARTMIIDEHLFGNSNFFGQDPDLRDFIVKRQFEIVINHLNAYRRPDDAEEVRAQMLAALKEDGTDTAEQDQASPQAAQPGPVQIPVNGVMDQLVRRLPLAKAHDSRSFVERSVRMLHPLVPGFVRGSIPIKYKHAFSDALIRRYERLTIQKALAAQAAAAKPAETPAAATSSAQDNYSRAIFYRRIADIYTIRGQIDLAAQMLDRSALSNDRYVASERGILALKEPLFAEADVSASMRRWSDAHAVPILSKANYDFPTRRSDERLTIAYHCIFWGSITGAAQALNFIALHDRSKFRVIGYSPQQEDASVKGAFDKFRITGDLDDGEFVDRLRADGVDIFVELSGLSPSHRLSAMASRCAPIQIAYLNHTSTTRVPNIDFVLADEIAAPQENDIHYTEEVYRLPGCFFCFDYDEQTLPAVVPPPHLKEGYITFGCFGRSDKLNATNLMYWARILQSVPGSKLLLQNPGLSSPSVRQFFRSQFSAFGCGPERLILLPGGERADVLANYARVDISLDTWPYCGGNTIAESVYQGVPVITLKGSRFSSAYGASLVTACGTPELVANTPEELVQIAVELSADSAKLSALRQDLRRMVRQHGFGDSKRFAQNLDEAYLNMARQKGLIEERASMRSEVEALASEASRPLIAKSA